MPKKLINDYFFYKIVCLDDSVDLCYVGSTANWNERRRNHKTVCTNENSKGYNIKVYKTIRANGGWDNFKMVEIGKAEQLTKRQAEQIEDEYRIELKANLNDKRCYLTEEQKRELAKEWREANKEHQAEWREANKEYLKEQHLEWYKNNIEHKKEYDKEYRTNNKEYYKEYNKEYRLQNHDKLLEYDKQRYCNDIKRQEYFKGLVVCECGIQGTKQHLSRHRKSKKHIQLMNELVQNK